jgi:Tol biopolymer transport system component
MKKIIFQATPKGEKQYAMFIAELESKDGKITGARMPGFRLTPPGTRNTCGYFAPDGQSLIFASTLFKEKPGAADEAVAGYQRQGRNYRWDFPDEMEIYSLPWDSLITFVEQGWANTKAKIRDPNATTEPFRPLDKFLKPLTDNNAYDAEGDFSPDGKWIVFSSRRDGDSELYVMKPVGSSPVRLTHVPGYDGGPFFSPDGKRILYRSDRKGNDLLQVFVSDLVFDVNGNITGIVNEKQLTDDGNVNWGPYFYPDGKHIIFATSVHGHQNYELYAMRDDGSHRVRITHHAGFDGLPVFSADGKYLMWSSKRSPDNTTQIFLARFTPPSDW